MEDKNKIEAKIWWRHWSAVFLLAVFAALVIWAMLNLGPWLKIWQDQRAARVTQKQLEEFYLNDKYGGKTPEETINLFITALRRDDIELASKYFVLDKQEAWLRTLTIYKSQDVLGSFIEELQSTTFFTQDMFDFYPSKVWKIKEI